MPNEYEPHHRVLWGSPITEACKRCRRAVGQVERHHGYRRLLAAGLSDIDASIASPLCVKCIGRHLNQPREHAHV
jgi:hypothetical protein